MPDETGKSDNRAFVEQALAQIEVMIAMAREAGGMENIVQALLQARAEAERVLGIEEPGESVTPSDSSHPSTH